jgi:allantoin racemase
MTNTAAGHRRVLLINPNVSTDMTRGILASARSVASPDLELTAVNPREGLPSIEGPYDGALVAPQVVDIAQRADAAGYAGLVIACFDDVALDAARSVATGPVVGICEASVTLCATVAWRFAIVTTTVNAVAVIERLVNRYGHSARCLVRAADIRVSDSQTGAAEALDRIRAKVKRTIEEEGAEAIILGSASMTGKAAALEREFGCPVIDPVVAGVALIDALTRMRARTSKLGAYSRPFEKTPASAREYTEF